MSTNAANEPYPSHVKNATTNGEKRAEEIVAANHWIVGQVKMDFIRHFPTFWVALWRHKFDTARANGIRAKGNSEAELHHMLTNVCHAVWRGPPPRNLYIPGTPGTLGARGMERGAYIYPTPTSTRLFTNGELLSEMNQDEVRIAMQGTTGGVGAIQSGTLQTRQASSTQQLGNQHVGYSTQPPPQGTSGRASRQGSPYDLDAELKKILDDPENAPQHYSRNENSVNPPSNYPGTAKAWGKTPASGQSGASFSSWSALNSRVSNSALQTGSPLPQPYPPHSTAPHHDSSRTPRVNAPTPTSGYQGVPPAPTGGHRGVIPALTGTPQHTIAPEAGGGRGYGQGSAHPNPVSRGRGGNSRGRGRGRGRGT